MAKRRNTARIKARRYWHGVRQHERTALNRQEDPRPAAPRNQVRASYGRPVI